MSHKVRASAATHARPRPRAAAQEVLDRIASNLTVDDLDIVTNGMAARVPATADPAAAPLPTQERELLWEHSGLGGRGRRAGEETLAVAGSGNAKAASVAAHALGKLLARSLTAGQFAARIDRDPSNVTRAANDGRLHSIRVGRERRFPTWQVQEDGSVLPGLPEVVSAIPDGMHPASVEGLMTTPQDDLDGMTPVDWLAGGGDPAPVARHLSASGRW